MTILKRSFENKTKLNNLDQREKSKLKQLYGNQQKRNYFIPKPMHTGSIILKWKCISLMLLLFKKSKNIISGQFKKLERE